MSIKVTVVVPSYNSGDHIERLVGSLLGQSLPPSQYEVILVDDGSTDATPQRFDELAATYPHIRTIHIPNSGWPGRPRNLGADAASGEYVYFVDADDWLEPEALERMYDMGRRNDSDIVIGRVLGHGRRVPGTLFQRNRESVTVGSAPLMETLTCHKMFRTQFLRDHAIRFPEGRRRLEDHVFVIEAYLRAGVVSVLSDYTCYHLDRRPDGGNISLEEFEPREYFEYLREAISVAEGLASGALLDRVLRRWYRVEMLGRLGGKRFLGYPDAYRRQMYDEIRRLAVERFARPGVWGPMNTFLRVRSELLQQGRYDDLVRLAEHETALVLVPRVDGVEWVDDHLRVALNVAVGQPDGTVVTCEATPVGRAMRLPLADVAPEARRVAATVKKAKPVVFVRHRDSGAEITLPVDGGAVDTPAVGLGQPASVIEYRCTATFDACTPAAAATGIWDVFVALSGWGGSPLRRRVGALHSPGLADLPVRAVPDEGTLFRPYWTNMGNLSIEAKALKVDQPAR
jgi:glycosyltransferase involved in cell wall biosynthesis